MNANMNLNLDLSKIDVKQLLAIAKKAQVYVFGLALIGIFGYTAYAVNGALNVKVTPSLPTATTSGTTATAKPKIVFDKATIATLKNLTSVDGNVPAGNLGTTDPFK